MMQIRKAVWEDVDRIMEFIKLNWNPKHILANNRDFFLWMYTDNKQVHFYLAEDENGKIYAMEGYIPYNHDTNPDMSGSMWKAIPCKECPTIGVELSLRMEHEVEARCWYGSGMSKRAIRMHRLWGHNVVKLDHYYRLGDRENYKIANIENKVIPSNHEISYQLVQLESIKQVIEVISDEELRKRVFFKDHLYLDKRYFKHPIWKYEVWKIDNDGQSDSIIVTREQEYNGAKILKIIDFIGVQERLAHVADAFDRLMEKREYEFVDIYSLGIACDILERGGFVRQVDNDSNIIPNLFAPFVRENHDIWMIEPSDKRLIMMRGDADQDRPC